MPFTNAELGALLRYFRELRLLPNINPSATALQDAIGTITGRLPREVQRLCLRKWARSRDSGAFVERRPPPRICAQYELAAHRAYQATMERLLDPCDGRGVRNARLYEESLAFGSRLYIGEPVKTADVPNYWLNAGVLMPLAHDRTSVETHAFACHAMRAAFVDAFARHAIEAVDHWVSQTGTRWRALQLLLLLRMQTEHGISISPVCRLDGRSAEDQTLHIDCQRAVYMPDLPPEPFPITDGDFVYCNLGYPQQFNVALSKGILYFMHTSEAAYSLHEPNVISVLAENRIAGKFSAYGYFSACRELGRARTAVNGAADNGHGRDGAEADAETDDGGSSYADSTERSPKHSDELHASEGIRQACEACLSTFNRDSPLTSPASRRRERSNTTNSASGSSRSPASVRDSSDGAAAVASETALLAQSSLPPGMQYIFITTSNRTLPIKDPANNAQIVVIFGKNLRYVFSGRRMNAFQH